MNTKETVIYPNSVTHTHMYPNSYAYTY